jgi:hypothetical protein
MGIRRTTLTTEHDENGSLLKAFYPSGLGSASREMRTPFGVTFAGAANTVAFPILFG